MRIMQDTNILFSAIHLPKSIIANMVDYIKDIKDLPVLVAAIEAQVDILITGDTDFDDVKIDKPRIMKPRQFQDEYINTHIG
jgi:predicted nucleic acid-binding protein